jgi:Zn-dependent protease
MRIFGIRIRIHILLVLFAAVIVASDFFENSAERGLSSLLFFGVLFFSVLLHELGHCYAGAQVGGTPRDVVIWLLGGLATIEGTPRTPGAQIVVSMAGPLVNVVLAGIFLLLMALFKIPIWPLFSVGDLSWLEILVKFGFLVNSILFAFNLIPALPLDGGNVLKWSLVDRLGFPVALATAGVIGQICAVLLGIGALVFLRSDISMLFFVVFTAVIIYLESERQRRTALTATDSQFSLWADDEPEFRPPDPPAPSKPSILERMKTKREARKREQEVRDEVELREKVDQLLEKISAYGYNALSDKEKTFLKEASKRFGNKKHL